MGSKQHVPKKEIKMVTVRLRNNTKTYPLIVPNKIKPLFKPGDLSVSVSNTVMLRPGGVYEVQEGVATWLKSMVPQWFI